MAQFEIIDEYTYEVCLLPKEKALAFVDYLQSIGINAKAKVGYSGNYIIFVTNELEVTKAKQELIRYATSPYAKEFNKASWDQGKTIKNEKQIKPSFALPLSINLLSITTAVELLCIVLYIALLVNEEFVLHYFTLNNLEQFDSWYSFYKLLTPSLVHFNFMHIAFNLVMFEAMGRPIENTFGKAKFLVLILSVALISNILQYGLMTHIGYFGGLSGVVYGVIGYSALVSLRKDLPASFRVPRGLFTVSVIFILLGFLFSGIANLCHLGGLVVGAVSGFIDYKRKSLK